MKKFIAVLMVLCTIAFVFAACSKTNETQGDVQLSTGAVEQTGNDTTEDNTDTTKSESTNPKVKFTMENGGVFVMELYPQFAPKTVENFVNLVKDGFYNGLTFHRVKEGFMAQGGAPNGDPNGGSGKTIKGEFLANGFEQNNLSHTRGVVSMARSQDNDSASSQFFICYDDVSQFLDGQYAAFGMVIEGMDVVDDFTKVQMERNSMGEMASPKEPIVIATAEII